MVRSIRNGVLGCVLAVSVFTLTGCRVDVEQVNAMSASYPFSDFSENIQVMYTDSGRMRMIMDAKVLVDLSERSSRPLYLFPKGVLVSKYEGDSVQTTLRADSVEHFLDSTSRTHLYNNVVIRDRGGATIKSEYMIWSRKEARIMTDSLVTIEREGERWVGRKGFYTDLDFSEYELRQVSGAVEVLDSL